MIGISATGSGKTLAFLLPAMIHINAQVDHFVPHIFRQTFSNLPLHLTL
jgi:superfamily II DNA/RNA helicase